MIEGIKEAVKNNEETAFDEVLPRDISESSVLKEHRVSIRFLSGRGCIVSVGCKEVAFESKERMLTAITRYFDNPKQEYAEWIKFFNK